MPIDDGLINFFFCLLKFQSRLYNFCKKMYCSAWMIISQYQSFNTHHLPLASMEWIHANSISKFTSKFENLTRSRRPTIRCLRCVTGKHFCSSFHPIFVSKQFSPFVAGMHAYLNIIRWIMNTTHPSSIYTRDTSPCCRFIFIVLFFTWFHM